MKDKGGHKLSRREFTQRAVILSATASVVPAQTLLGEPAEELRREETQESKSAVQPPPNQPKLSPESQAEADARCQQVLTLYGNRLTDEDRNTTKIICNYLQPSLDRIRSFSLENAAAPALYLRPLVERGKKAPATPSAKATPAPKKP